MSRLGRIHRDGGGVLDGMGRAGGLGRVYRNGGGMLDEMGRAGGFHRDGEGVRDDHRDDR